ncbi:MAG: GDSL-type esterase/lipase family protein [Ferruginibacter sp.]|nr:GDSL-type esterase/lipase family protein [Ferruginibacter sp.]
MKSWFLSIGFCLVGTVKLFSQSVIDTTYFTTYYDQKVSLFKLLPNTKKEIIFLGDSITDIGEWGEIWKNKAVKNRGISSDNTFGVLARLPEITEGKPAKIFIMIGINDIAKNTPDNIIVSNYKKIINNIQTATPTTKIIVQSILPTNNTFTAFKNHQNKTQHILFINAALQKYCAENKIVYVDLYNGFIDSENKLDKKYTNDGLHVNGYGYMKWEEILMERNLMK